MRTRRDTPLGFQPPAIGDEEIAAVAETLRSGWLTTGPRAALLEERLAVSFALDDDTSSCQARGGGAKKKGTAVVFLVPPAGRLVEVEGVAEAQAVQGVEWVRVYRRPGHVFGPLRRGADRAGAVLVTGADRDSALERGRRAADAVRFRVDADAS